MRKNKHYSSGVWHPAICCWSSMAPWNSRITLSGQSARSSLRAFISLDDGKSWQGDLLLDRRIGISYPDGQQAADGSIYIAYDHSRTGAKSIHFAVLREEDALAGRPVSGGVRLREIVTTGIQNPPVAPADGQALITRPAGRMAAGNGEELPLTQFQMVFKDQTLEIHDYPPELEGASFLQLARDGQKVVRVTRSGMVFVFTPQPHRSDFSQSERLTKKGFTPVALPEFAMWWWREAEIGALYQKYAREGETIEFGRWAIPICFPD